MKPKGSWKDTVKNYWKSFMESVKNRKMSRGAENITTSITSAHKDNWKPSPYKGKSTPGSKKHK